MDQRRNQKRNSEVFLTERNENSNEAQKDVKKCILLNTYIIYKKRSQTSKLINFPLKKLKGKE